MSRRSKIVSAQAAAVALLVLIVYVTLLRPDSTAPLRGIQAPSDGQQANKPSDHGGAGHGHRGPAHGGGTPGNGTDGGTGGGPAGGGQTGPAGGGTFVSGVTPPGDQYSDSVSALLSKVAMAVPAGGTATGRADG